MSTSQHSFSTSLPVEILNKVLFHVDVIKSSKWRVQTLRACTTVCHHFREISRPLLHSALYINQDWDADYDDGDFMPQSDDCNGCDISKETSARSSQTAQQVVDLVSCNPEIIPFVRKIYYIAKHEDQRVSGLARTMSRLYNVQAITFNGSRLSSLEEIPALYDTFLCMIGLPSLSYLRLEEFSRLPMFSILPRLSGIDTLDFQRVSFHNTSTNFYGPVSGIVLGPYQEPGPKRLTISNTQSPQASTLLPRLHLGRLEELKYVYMQQDELSVIMNQLKHCANLRFVSLEVRYGEFVTWVGLSRLAHTASLRHLRLECNPFIDHNHTRYISEPLVPSAPVTQPDIFQGLIPQLAALHQVETLDLRMCLPNDFIITSMRSEWQNDPTHSVWAQFGRTLLSLGGLRKVVVTLIGLYVDLFSEFDDTFMEGLRLVVEACLLSMLRERAEVEVDCRVEMSNTPPEIRLDF